MNYVTPVNKASSKEIQRIEIRTTKGTNLAHQATRSPAYWFHYNLTLWHNGLNKLFNLTTLKQTSLGGAFTALAYDSRGLHSLVNAELVLHTRAVLFLWSFKVCTWKYSFGIKLNMWFAINWHLTEKNADKKFKKT